MKKLITIALVLGLALVVTSANAEDKYVAGGFEASGHVNAGLGYQHFTNRASTYYTWDGDTSYYAGVMGKYQGVAPGARRDFLNFFVDEVELDIMKSFGENVRLRADLDFGRVNSSGVGTAAFVLEQAYATANIPVGNGIEFLLGRFNAPIGFEAIDINDNDTISTSVLRQGLRPTNVTGAKIYYSFSDLVDLHFYVVNKLFGDTTVKANEVPSIGARLGFNWGDEGTESTLGISPFWGPESTASNKHYTFGADVDLNWWITESFALGAEAYWARFNDVTSTTGVAASGNSKTQYMSGLLNLHYVFSDVWDGTLKYVFAKQWKLGQGNQNVAGVGNTLDPGIANSPAGAGSGINSLTGYAQSLHQISLAGGYAIADGAKFKLEGRMDIIRPTQDTALGAASRTQYVYGAALDFEYNF